MSDDAGPKASPAAMPDAADLFDGHAEAYEAALAEGLDVTGEGAEFYARGRVEHLRRRLDRLGVVPRRILDFGCGTGGSAPFLAGLPGVEQVVGVDVSDASLAVARARHGGRRDGVDVRFERTDAPAGDGTFDLAFCNGVFHHIPPAERAGVVRSVHRRLRPGGLFALWENNPWNPGVRYVMSRVSFDRDAITLSPPETRRLLAAHAFAVVRTDFLFYFPRRLALLRGVEQWLLRVPFGGQYLTLVRRADASPA